MQVFKSVNMTVWMTHQRHWLHKISTSSAKIKYFNCRVLSLRSDIESFTYAFIYCPHSATGLMYGMANPLIRTNILTERWFQWEEANDCYSYKNKIGISINFLPTPCIVLQDKVCTETGYILKKDPRNNSYQLQQLLVHLFYTYSRDNWKIQ